MLSRERRRVVASERVGLYTLLRVERGGLDAGIPGQFFMLEAPGRILPRPMSLCLAPPGELGFLFEPIGPGTRALDELERDDELHVLGPLGNGFRLDVERPLLVGGGIGIAPLPYLSETLGRPPAVLGFRSSEYAAAASLLPNAEVVIDPTLVTDVLPTGYDVLARRTRARGAAGLGGADGLRLRRVLRVRRRDRRAPPAPVRRGPGHCCLTRRAASTRLRRRMSPGRSMPS